MQTQNHKLQYASDDLVTFGRYDALNWLWEEVAEAEGALALHSRRWRWSSARTFLIEVCDVLGCYQFNDVVVRTTALRMGSRLADRFWATQPKKNYGTTLTPALALQSTRLLSEAASAWRRKQAARQRSVPHAFAYSVLPALLKLFFRRALRSSEARALTAVREMHIVLSPTGRAGYEILGQGFLEPALPGPRPGLRPAAEPERPPSGRHHYEGGWSC